MVDTTANRIKWITDTVEGMPTSFDAGFEAAQRVMEDPVLGLTEDQRVLQELPMRVLGALQAEGQGAERQLNSNAGFVIGALAAAFERLELPRRGV